MDKWLKAAIEYLPTWLEFQVRLSEQPGCIIAVAHRGTVVLERAFGHADPVTAEPLTPRHRLTLIPMPGGR
jgi:hypothetical protein